MPVILGPAQFDQWMLAPAEEAALLMRPYAGPVDAWEVSKRVNSPRMNDESLIARLSSPSGLVAATKRAKVVTGSLL